VASKVVGGSLVGWWGCFGGVGDIKNKRKLFLKYKKSAQKVSGCPVVLRAQNKKIAARFGKKELSRKRDKI